MDPENRITPGDGRLRGGGSRGGTPRPSAVPAAPAASINRRFVDLKSSADVFALPDDFDVLKLLLVEAVATRSGAAEEARRQGRLHRSRRPQHRLTEAMLGRLAPNRRYSDGNGLYAEVSGTGKVKWIQRLTFQGRRRDYGHGGWPAVSLEEAREKSLAFLREVRAGRDPRGLRRGRVPTVDDAWEAVLPNWRMSWRENRRLEEEKTARSLYERLVRPVLGNVALDRLDPEQVAAVLRPHWKGRGTLGHRLYQLLRRIGAWAVVQGYRPDSVVESAHLLLPQVKRRPRNFASVPWADAPKAFKAIRSVGFPDNMKAETRFEVARLGLQFTVLTATRSGEVRSAVWGEIDPALEWEAGKIQPCWKIPAERIKMGRPHMIPLSPQALAVLDAMRALGHPQGPEDLVFGCGHGNGGSALRDSEMLAVLRVAVGGKATVHGWRATFGGWCVATDAEAEEVADAALAHAKDSQVRAAYFRESLFGRRVPLMAAWGDYLWSAGNGNGSGPGTGTGDRGDGAASSLLRNGSDPGAGTDDDGDEGASPSPRNGSDSVTETGGGGFVL